MDRRFRERLKPAVLRRDHGICHLCGHPGADSADHLLPRKYGGKDTLANLAAVHHDAPPKCNRIRGDRLDLTTVRAEIAARQAHTPASTGWDW